MNYISKLLRIFLLGRYTCYAMSWTFYIKILTISIQLTTPKKLLLLPLLQLPNCHSGRDCNKGGRVQFLYARFNSSIWTWSSVCLLYVLQKIESHRKFKDTLIYDFTDFAAFLETEKDHLCSFFLSRKTREENCTWKGTLVTTVVSRWNWKLKFMITLTAYNRGATQVASNFPKFHNCMSKFFLLTFRGILSLSLPFD